jgi:NAD(P)-dependent dehydrogenase (short-subunit alcohol dehydrogenase family)
MFGNLSIVATSWLRLCRSFGRIDLLVSYAAFRTNRAPLEDTSDSPSPTLTAYASAKAATANLCASLACLLGEPGIWVNHVAPGPSGHR